MVKLDRRGDNMKNWNYENIGSLKDKTILITGGNSGLGFESAAFYASKDATVIIASRSLERGETAKDEILKVYPNATLDVHQMDLESLSSIKVFVDTIKDKYDHIDILLNNAGIMTVPYGLTEDGFEKQFGVNHLGHFALTAQLFDLIKKGNDPRIVNISSVSHRIGTMDFHNLMYEQGAYSEARAYGRSKLANLLFTLELDRRLKEAHVPIKVLAAHPGVSNTNLMRHIDKRGIYKMFNWLIKLMVQPAFNGALPGIRAALDEDANSGDYFGPSGLLQFKGKPVLVKPGNRAYNKVDSKKLWEKSEELTKIEFKIKAD